MLADESGIEESSPSWDEPEEGEFEDWREEIPDEWPDPSEWGIDDLAEYLDYVLEWVAGHDKEWQSEWWDEWRDAFEEAEGYGQAEAG